MNSHRPILVDAVVDALCIDPEGDYVDATFGRGGHTPCIASALVARRAHSGDRPRPRAAIVAAQALANEDARVLVRHGRMSEMGASRDEAHSRDVVGVLMDLGVSSPQLDDPRRGMSFRGDGPLDMRMDPTAGVSGIGMDQQGERRRTCYGVSRVRRGASCAPHCARDRDASW